MNELRELNLAEMAQLEGGQGEAYTAWLVAGFELLFNAIAAPLAFVIAGAATELFDFLAEIFRGLE